MARRILEITIALALLSAPRAASAANCAGTSTGLVPLTDLGAGTHLGAQGGLYAGGSNLRPSAHDAAGLAIATSIVPRDTSGNPDPVNGRIVMFSIGMSNTTQEFSRFVPKATNDPQRHPKLLVIDAAKGGQSANVIANPAYWYWDTVETRLRGRGSSPLQAQVVWIKEADPGPTGGFPTATLKLQRELGTIVRIVKDRFPNVQLCYLSSRIYAGYASTGLNPEPYAYESGFAVKWLIDSQVSGEDSLNFDLNTGPVEAPWMAWGPYLWADGLTPRGDGMTWECAHFANDGTHPSVSGAEKVADSLLAFFKSDATTIPWFRATSTASAPAPAARAEPGVTIAPNPSGSAMEIAFAPAAGAAWRLAVYDLSGRRIRELDRGTGDGAALTRRWDGRDDSGAAVRVGVYWIRLAAGGGDRAARAVWLGGR